MAAPAGPICFAPLSFPAGAASGNEDAASAEPVERRDGLGDGGGVLRLPAGDGAVVDDVDLPVREAGPPELGHLEGRADRRDGRRLLARGEGEAGPGEGEAERDGETGEQAERGTHGGMLRGKI